MDIYHHLKSLEELLKLLEKKETLDKCQRVHLEDLLNEIKFALPKVPKQSNTNHNP